MDKKMRHRGYWLAMLAVIAGMFWYFSRPEPVQVELYAVDTGRVELTVANTRSGTVQACQRSRLSLPIGGQIETLHVSEGDTVMAGQPLVSLWNQDRKASVQLEQARVVSAERDHDSACITSRSDAKESGRLQTLVQQGLASREAADMAGARAAASKAACAAADARVAQARASLQLAQAQLQQTILKAPFAGMVAEVTGEVGEFATPSPPGIPTPPAIDLLTHDCHYITAPIDEVDAALVTLGLPARVSLDAFRGRVFPATVRRIAPYVLDLEKQARTVDVEADLQALPDDVSLLAGYSADLEIIVQSKEQVVRVPTELLIGEAAVLVVDENNTIAEQSVVTGISNWTWTEIVSGLQPGDRIIKSIGQSGVATGSRVEVQQPGDD